jgi:hemolysin III
MVDNPKFTRRYMIVNEVLNAVTHGIATVAAIVGLVFLLIKNGPSGNALTTTSYAIYGGTLILLFLSSTLFHSLIFTKAAKVFQVFDHASIFLLIAGSYTPFCLIAIGGRFGWTLLILIWAIAIAGVVFKAITLSKSSEVPLKSTVIYIVLGWIVILAAKPLYDAIGWNGIWLLVGGGLAYTVGAFFYQMKNVRFMHVVWHIFVALGATLMYFSVLLTA